jgi:putative membrane protein
MVQEEAVMARTIVFVILLVVVLLFVVQNTQVVEVQFVVWKVSMSRALMLLGALLIGIVIGLLARGRRRAEKAQS